MSLLYDGSKKAHGVSMSALRITFRILSLNGRLFSKEELLNSDDQWVEQGIFENYVPAADAAFPR